MLPGTGEYGGEELGDAGVLGLLEPALELVPQHRDELLLAEGAVTVLQGTESRGGRRASTRDTLFVHLIWTLAGSLSKLSLMTGF